MDSKATEQRLQAVADALKNDLQALRTNRPSAKLVEDIKVEYYGQILPVKQMGSIAIVPPREVIVTPWDASATAAVAKAIEASSLGVGTNVSGNVIRINLPQLTEERKKEIEKMVRKTVEEARIHIRGLRDEANKEIKKQEEGKQISEDVAFKNKEAVQKSVDRVNGEMEALLTAKIKEIFES